MQIRVAKHARRSSVPRTPQQKLLKPISNPTEAKLHNAPQRHETLSHHDTKLFVTAWSVVAGSSRSCTTSSIARPKHGTGCPRSLSNVGSQRNMPERCLVDGNPPFLRSEKHVFDKHICLVAWILRVVSVETERTHNLPRTLPRQHLLGAQNHFNTLLNNVTSQETQP